jgi:photosystem II stability/assembly factor-like uncharacterized protein
MKKSLAILSALLFLTPFIVSADEKKPEGQDRLNSMTFAGLELRNIGPALMSGRVSDIAIHPTKPSTWYVAVASGNVWKTTNAGTTWTPIFDNYGSYSIGCVSIDPSNPNIIWIGTGEDKGQRSVGYGDGIYKSVDDGKSFKNMGLKDSQHISRIVVDPRDSNVVYVAAQGPLWSPGGDRGLYKTTDGGETWQKVLEVSENTGVTDIVYDPRNPDTLYAASFQRRRHVWTLINGGPESAIYKSTDAGKSWRKLTGGLPQGDVGKIALAVSPQNPDVVYADVEAERDTGGFFRSTDRGESWTRMSGYVSDYPMYYQEIYCDPHRFDVIYSVDTMLSISEDGGANWHWVGEQWKHSDNHAIAFYKHDPDFLLVGCDGGVYQSWDRGKTWDFIANLPVTQFYKIDVDNSLPFYYVYGGTQDNDTEGAPSRTNNVHGIRNSDWFIVVGGDGFQPRVDPNNPDIVYGQSQYGNLVRFDRKSGEAIDIQPQVEPGEDASRWNWDSPLIISPHSGTRLYFASQRLYRSDDRGDTWTAVSPDLTRQIDRNKLEVMGTVWGVDAVEKNQHTSPYGNIVSLTESPLVEGLIYTGSDDGVIQVTEDGGADWRKMDKFPGVPEFTYVSDVYASPHEPDTVFACFTNHKMGDFKPYLLKSTDRGRTWTSIANNLPDRYILWSIVQDHVKKDLLFVGTEFGVFFSIDGGKHWVQLKGGMPTIAVRDLEIQKRENDLVCATFGRGIFILDDYTPLRLISPEALEQDTILFPVKKTWMYIEADPLGGGEKSSQGDSFYNAPNPPFGAVFTYYLKEGLSTLKSKRIQEEKKLQKEGKPVYYPSWEDLKLEDREEAPLIVLTVADEAGNVVRRLTGPTWPGFHRIAWDLRYPSTTPARSGEPRFSWYTPQGPMAMPGKYTVSIAKYADGKFTPLGETQTFECEPLGLATLPAEDKAELLAFQKQTAELLRAVMGANAAANEAMNRIAYIKRALIDTPNAEAPLIEEVRALELKLTDLMEELTGDPTKPMRAEPATPSIMSRVQQIVYGHWSSSSAPTNTHRRNFEIASQQFSELVGKLKAAIEVDLVQLEMKLEAAGAPYTPGRVVPDWPPK